MQIILDRNDEQTLTVKTVTVVLSEDVEFRIQTNQFGELVLTKKQFGDGDGALNIKPSVSNEIRVL